MQCPYCKEEVNDGALKCKHCGSDLTLLPKTVNAGAADIGGMLNAAFTVWKENLGDLVILTLVFLLICWIPVANIGFIAGYTRSLLKVARGQGKAQVGDLFNAWDCFVDLFVFVLINLIIVIVLHFIPVLGTLAACALGVAGCGDRGFVSPRDTSLIVDAPMTIWSPSFNPSSTSVSMPSLMPILMGTARRPALAAPDGRT